MTSPDHTPGHLYEQVLELAKREIDAMDNIKFVQINHLHPSNDLHLSQFTLKQFDDLPPGATEERQAAHCQT